MIRNALFASTTALLAVVFLLFERLSFLSRYRQTLFLHCGASLALFAGLLWLNLFAAAWAVNRKFFLKDTGKKLAHLDRHLQAKTGDVPPATEEGR